MQINNYSTSPFCDNNLLPDPNCPTNSNKLKESNQQKWNRTSKLIKKLKQVYSIAQDERNTHNEECHADDCYGKQKFVCR